MSEPYSKRARAGLVAATIVLRKLNIRLHMQVCARANSRGDGNVAACPISRAIRLSLHD